MEGCYEKVVYLGTWTMSHIMVHFLVFGNLKVFETDRTVITFDNRHTELEQSSGDIAKVSSLTRT